MHRVAWVCVDTCGRPRHIRDAECRPSDPKSSRLTRSASALSLQAMPNHRVREIMKEAPTCWLLMKQADRGRKSSNPPPAISVIHAPGWSVCRAATRASGRGLGPNSGDIQGGSNGPASLSEMSRSAYNLCLFCSINKCYQCSTGRSLTNNMPDLKLIKFHVIT